MTPSTSTAITLIGQGWIAITTENVDDFGF
jgi:hypothetical protein